MESDLIKKFIIKEIQREEYLEQTDGESVRFASVHIIGVLKTYNTTEEAEEFIRKLFSKGYQGVFSIEPVYVGIK